MSLVGKPYAFNGRGEDTYDCLGLTQAYLESQGIHESFSDGKPIESGWYESQPLRMIRYFLKNFQKIKSQDNIKKNDIVLFQINGESHLGVAIDNYHRILTTFPGTQSSIVRLSLGGRYFICGFRIKAGDEL